MKILSKIVTILFLVSLMLILLGCSEETKYPTLEEKKTTTEISEKGQETDLDYYSNEIDQSLADLEQVD